MRSRLFNCRSWAGEGCRRRVLGTCDPLRLRCTVVRCTKQGSSPFGDAGARSRKGGGQGGGQGKQAQGNSKKPQARRSAPPPKKAPTTISLPLQVELLDEGAVSQVQGPTWEGFCSGLQGEWVGQYGAYTPWEGKPEPVWVDSNNKYIDCVYTRSVEHADSSEDGRQQLVRKIGRAPQLAQLSQLPIPTEGTTVEGDNIDVEALAFNSDGVVVFDGGHYSAGPDFIGPPEFKLLQDADDDEPDPDAAASTTEAGGKAQEAGKQLAAASQDAGVPAPTPAGQDTGRQMPDTISIFEQCLVDQSSKSRVRVKATVTIGQTDNGEVDVTVLRLVLFREVWAGQVGAASMQLPKVVLEPTPCTRLPRPTERQVSGEWRCQTHSAVSVEEAPPTLPAGSEPGPLETPLDEGPDIRWDYSLIQDRQVWELPRGQTPEEGADGGMLWLPGGVLVTFKMVAMSSDDDSEVEQEPALGNRAAVQGKQRVTEQGSAPPRGFCMGMTWLHATGRALQVERYYDEVGCLRDVRCTQGSRDADDAVALQA